MSMKQVQLVNLFYNISILEDTRVRSASHMTQFLVLSLVKRIRVSSLSTSCERLIRIGNGNMSNLFMVLMNLISRHGGC